MKQRRKETCWGCRGVKCSSSGTECALGYTITLTDSGYYRPGRGEICPKPATYRQLSDALRRESILGGG